MLIINAKTYAESDGPNQERLIQDLTDLDDSRVYYAPNLLDTAMIASQYPRCLAQHVDPVTYGSHTGHVLPEQLVRLSLRGSLINHSERSVPIEHIESAVEQLKKQGLVSVVCVPNVELVSRVAAFKPDYVAIEPPELIGGEISVSTAQPNLIRDAVEAANEYDVPLLCGAGVKNADDVSKALELGAKGVLVASGVIKADDPVKATKELLRGF